MAEASAIVVGWPAATDSMWRKIRLRTLTRATSMLASLSWISWKSLMGLPQSVPVLGVPDRDPEALFDDAQCHGGDPRALGDEVRLRALAATSLRLLAPAEQAVGPTRTS